MSRNLGEIECHYCHGPVALLEGRRPITREDAGVYFDEYANVLVANAECEHCEAKYLAWVDDPPRAFARREGYGDFVDLSFRSTFNDEPGPDDLPKWDVKRLRLAGAAVQASPLNDLLRTTGQLPEDAGVVEAAILYRVPYNRRADPYAEEFAGYDSSEYHQRHDPD